MRHLFFLFTTLVIFTWAAPAPVAGDDGLYCLGAGYLAYQLQESPETGRQQLTVVRLDPQLGVVEIRTHEIEAFPVLGMRCLKEQIDLLAWDRIRRFDLQDADSTQPARVEPDPEDSLLPDFSEESLLRVGGATGEVPLNVAEGRFTLLVASDGPKLRHDRPDGTRIEIPLPGP
ncbi:MAG: hypothetical protein RBT64_05595 [Trichloromonas sp.]|jgi:hypothetical protein|nr:hypothetical protein [Trichloromonas sp.]